MRILRRALAWFGAMMLLGVTGLVGVAWFSTPAPIMAEALSSLEPHERTALQRLLARGNVAPTAIRALGGYYRGLLDVDANRHAVWIDHGHVRAMRLAGWPEATAPDLSAFNRMEVLWLDDGRLSEWPDMSRLAALQEVQLRRQPLTSIDGERLPPSIVDLGLAHTAVTNVDALAGATTLRTLDLAHTGVANFSVLVPLALDRLDLSHCPVASLPEKLPRRRHGDWSVNLDGTPVLNPPGFSRVGPGGYAFAGTAFGREERHGHIGSGKADASGYGERLPALRPVVLQTINDRGVYDVVIEASVDAGRARVWLHTPDDFWTSRSRWFSEVDIDGFGFAMQETWVHVDLEAGKTTALRGRLMRLGPPDRPELQFLIAPIGNDPVREFRYRVRIADQGRPQ